PARAIARAPVPPPIAARRVSAEEAMSRKVGLSLWLHGPKAHWLAHFRAQVTAERLPRTASFMSRGRSIRVIGDSFAVGTRPAAQRSGALTTVRQEDEAGPSAGETEDELWRPPGPHHRRSSPPEPAPPQIWRMRELNGHGAFNSRIRQESGGTGPAGPGSGAGRLRTGPAQNRAGATKPSGLTSTTGTGDSIATRWEVEPSRIFPIGVRLRIPSTTMSTSSCSIASRMSSAGSSRLGTVRSWQSRP